MAKPVLWVSLTTEGRHSAPTTQETMDELREALGEAVGDDYEVVVADDRVRLLGADEVQQMLKDLQDYAAQFAHEDAMAESIENAQDEG